MCAMVLQAPSYVLGGYDAMQLACRSNPGWRWPPAVGDKAPEAGSSDAERWLRPEYCCLPYEMRDDATRLAAPAAAFSPPASEPSCGAATHYFSATFRDGVFIRRQVLRKRQMNNLPGNKKPRNNCRWSSFDGSGAAGESGAIMDS